MKAIILAAGVGKRLGDRAAGKPKCLLELGGMSLLHRHFLNLEDSPVTDVIVVTGYRQEEVLAELGRIQTGLNVQTRFNQDFTQGSLVSLWKASGDLSSGDDIILMDADVLYEKAIFKKLTLTTVPNCFLLDRKFEPGEEPVKLCVQDGRLVEFRKLVDRSLAFDFQGESVGFFRFSPGIASRLARRVQEYMDQQRRSEPYEEAIRDLLLAEPDVFGYEDITGLSWIEIDFPEDMDRAEIEILNNI